MRYVERMRVIVDGLAHLKDIELDKDETYLEQAWMGDLYHKLFLRDHFGSRKHSRLLELVTNQNQADWLRYWAPELLPPNNPNGTAPSDWSCATRFECLYCISPALRTFYNNTITSGLWKDGTVPGEFSDSDIEHRRMEVQIADKLIAECGVAEVILYQCRGKGNQN